MTFAHYDFVRGSSVHEHFHVQEEVWEVIEGEIELTIDGVTQIARANMVAIVPSNARHSVKALTDGRAIIIDYPLRHDFDGAKAPCPRVRLTKPANRPSWSVCRSRPPIRFVFEPPTICSEPR